MILKKDLVKYGLILSGLSIALACYFWLSCRNLCLSVVLDNKELIFNLALSGIKKLIMIFGVFLLLKIAENILRRTIKFLMSQLGKSDKTPTINKLLSFLIWAVFIVFSLSIFIGDLTALVASLGLVGFGLTFALQKPILNFVGWLVILFKELYTEGDRIKIHDVIGDVKEIQVMNTIVEGLLQSSDVLSGKTISFPNEFILSTEVENFTKESNYIVNELRISITYESDYHKAIRLLRDIIIKQIKMNKSKYFKKIIKQKSDLNDLIAKWIDPKSDEKSQVHEESVYIEQLKNEKEELEHDLKELEEEFKPLIRIEMLDSAIELIAQYKCPYDEIRKNRTEINIAFLDQIRKGKDIEIAYPHMQIVNKPDTAPK
ncbi:MAG: mechanosensitive ion channel domain-containing protein [archaeon]